MISFNTFIKYSFFLSALCSILFLLLASLYDSEGTFSFPASKSRNATSLLHTCNYFVTSTCLLYIWINKNTLVKGFVNIIYFGKVTYKNLYLFSGCLFSIVLFINIFFQAEAYGFSYEVSCFFTKSQITCLQL